MDMLLIVLTVLALGVACSVTMTLWHGLAALAQPQLDMESLGPDAGLWPGIYRPSAPHGG